MGSPVSGEQPQRRSPEPDSPPVVAYLVRSYPRLSQTFILNEILAVESLGIHVQLFALTNPHEGLVQRETRAVTAPIRYLDRSGRVRLSAVRQSVLEHIHALVTSPRRYATTLSFILRRKDLDVGYRVATRFQCFDHAIRLQRLLRTDHRRTGAHVEHLHAHFAHDPTLVTLLTHRLTGIPFSFTAHARDLYQLPLPTLIERVREASSVVTCCEANAEHLRRHLPEQLHSKMRLIHHGTDPDRFRPADPRPARTAPPLILSVGRLVEKKGFGDLIEACDRLAASGTPFRCEIYGDGPERQRLQQRIDELGLSERVTLMGARRVEDILEAYQNADVFALVPFVTEDGDRDGIPNVVIEAMSCGLPVVATAVAGIPEVVQHGTNGLLTPTRDVRLISESIRALLTDPGVRERLGGQARATVVQRFDSIAAARALVAGFGPAAERTGPIS